MKPGRTTFNSHRREAPTGAGFPAPLLLLGVAVVTLLFVIAASVPAVLVLPLFGMTAVVGAAGFAVFAWWRNDDHDAAYVTWWDMAGAFALIGFAAVLLSNPEEVLALLGQ
jgi:hypothetical protein